MPKRNYPGRMTHDEWRALPYAKRRELTKRAQSDLLGSFRFCTQKPCRRHRTCCGKDPYACAERLWQRTKKKPKTLRNEYARIGALQDG